MAYRIDYIDSEKNQRGNILPYFLMSLLFFVSFMVFVALYWPEGSEVLRILLEPVNPAEAAEAFAGDLKNGVSVKNAFVSFLKSVTEYGNSH